MFDKHRPTERDLRRTRDEFRAMLEQRTEEAQWQKFFSDNPYVLSMSFPLRLAPEDIVPMARPGRTEPDFVFYGKKLEPIPIYGVIEIKKPHSRIITLTRSNVAILSRDAATAVQQVIDYSKHQKNHLKPKQESILFLGNQQYLFVIMIPTRLHVLVPAVESDLGSSKEDEALARSIDRALLERAIEALSPGDRIIYVLHDIEGYEHNEIAEMMGCSISDSKNQLYKARTKMKSLLQTTTGLPEDVTRKWIDHIQKEFAQQRKETGRKRG